MLTALEHGVRNIISIDSTTRAHGLNNSHHVNSGGDKFSKTQPVTQNTETMQTENEEYIVGRIMRHVIEDIKTNYVMRSYGFTLVEDIIEPPCHLSSRFVAGYWQHHKGQHYR